MSVILPRTTAFQVVLAAMGAIVGMVGVAAAQVSKIPAAPSLSQKAGYNAFGARLAPVEPPRSDVPVVQSDDGQLTVGGHVFQNWSEYFNSAYFAELNRKCATTGQPDPAQGGAPGMGGPDGGSQADCSGGFTNPSTIYAPPPGNGNPAYRIPVVVHVIRNTAGTQGNLSTAMVQSQIDILNEDYLALAGTNGQNGTNGELRFYLATTDPGGNPTTGITFHNNDTWFNDGGAYYNSIAWNPQRYLNIYTNNPGAGILGYAFIPQGGGAGSAGDRVVILWTAFGRNSLGGPPYNQGRTATHEVGHYLGLYHTFQGGCGTATPPGCYQSGDLICDTNPDATQHFGCPGGTSCGFPIPSTNYMEYTDDLCMNKFTPEQCRRMRCTVEHWRPLLYEIYNLAPINDLCVNATLVGAGSYPFTTVNSGTDGPDETSACNFNGFTQISNDIWYKYFAQCTGTATVSLCGANYNAKLAAYGSACPAGPGSTIACNDNFCGNAPQVSFPVVANTIYRVRIGGVSGATGTGTMVISCSAPPPCPPDITGDGQVNINDLLSVINGWGACPAPPATCPADITADGQVNINDLLAVINAWGPCP